MPTTPFRLKRSKERISDLLKVASGGKEVSLDALPPDLREALDKAIQNDAEIPEQRMRRTMRRVAEGIGLRWDDDHPSNHPYRAELDGQLYRERTLVAVVELETKNPKQIRGALIDLIAYPEAKKILVIGESRVIRDAKKMKSEVLEGSCQQFISCSIVLQTSVSSPSKRFPTMRN